MTVEVVMPGSIYSKGKAFEYFIKRLLLIIGFREICPDTIYIFEGPAGLMINGLGEAHNADVLLEPPVQTPFYMPTRLLIECKSYTGKVGIDVIRGVLGLRDDINVFNYLDDEELKNRKNNKRIINKKNNTYYFYQVAVASLKGYSVAAQNFAAAHRIPLIQLDNMPYWGDFLKILESPNDYYLEKSQQTVERQIDALLSQIGKRLALAVTNSGQILLLFNSLSEIGEDDDYKFCQYKLLWQDKNSPWEMVIGNSHYLFQLPDELFKSWVANSSSEFDLRKNAMQLKYEDFSSMMMYYSINGQPHTKMISIDKSSLKEAEERLNQN